MHGFFLLLLAVCFRCVCRNWSQSFPKLAPICFVTAKQIVITVGHNVTNDATKVFQPASVVAQTGDVVYFNFTLGNHTATQSTFSSPCIPAHDTNVTVNGLTQASGMPVTVRLSLIYLSLLTIQMLRYGSLITTPVPRAALGVSISMTVVRKRFRGFSAMPSDWTVRHPHPPPAQPLLLHLIPPRALVTLGEQYWAVSRWPYHSSWLSSDPTILQYIPSLTKGADFCQCRTWIIAHKTRHYISLSPYLKKTRDFIGSDIFSIT